MDRARVVKKPDWPAIGGLLVLSALWAAGWLRADLAPGLRAEELPISVSQAVLFSVFAAVAGAGMVVRRVAIPRGRRAWAFAGLGAGFFALPAALTAFAQGRISTLDQVAALSLTPVFAVVLEPHLQSDGPRQGNSALLGSLAALSGVLCLFPLDVPHSARAGAGLCAVVAAAFLIAAANCVAVRLASGTEGGSDLPLACLAGTGAALCFAVFARATPHDTWRWGTAFGAILLSLVTDLPALILLVWLMGRMSATRMTARFLLAPLFTILGGIAFEPSAPPLRAIVGMVLLAGGAGWLVLAPPEQGTAESFGFLMAGRR